MVALLRRAVTRAFKQFVLYLYRVCIFIDIHTRAHTPIKLRMLRYVILIYFFRVCVVTPSSLPTRQLLRTLKTSLKLKMRHPNLASCSFGASNDQGWAVFVVPPPASPPSSPRKVANDFQVTLQSRHCHTLSLQWALLTTSPAVQKVVGSIPTLTMS